MKKAYGTYGTQSKETMSTLQEFHKEKRKNGTENIFKAIWLKTSQTW